MHLCILQNPYNKAGAHGFILLYHRLRSENGWVDTKFDSVISRAIDSEARFIGILGTSFPEPYLAMEAAEHQTWAI